ncbi:Serine/threonine-protein phosphatase dullard-A, partial [Caligus rogercresseyi]
MQLFVEPSVFISLRQVKTDPFLLILRFLLKSQHAAKTTKLLSRCPRNNDQNPQNPFSGPSPPRQRHVELDWSYLREEAKEDSPTPRRHLSSTLDSPLPSLGASAFS